LFPLFAIGVIDTIGKFAAGVVDTGGKLPPVSLTPSEKLPPVSLIPVKNLPLVSTTLAKLEAQFVTGVVDTEWDTLGSGGNRFMKKIRSKKSCYTLPFSLILIYKKRCF